MAEPCFLEVTTQKQSKMLVVLLIEKHWGRNQAIALVERNVMSCCDNIPSAQRAHPVRGKDRSPPACNNSASRTYFLPLNADLGHTKGSSSCRSDVSHRIPISTI